MLLINFPSAFIKMSNIVSVQTGWVSKKTVAAQSCILLTNTVNLTLSSKPFLRYLQNLNYLYIKVSQ